MRVFDFNRAIVRLPAPSVVDGLRAGDHDDPTFEGIAREHAAYVEALERAGLSVTVLPPLADHPDSIFVEDPALVFPEGAIRLRSRTPSRAGEPAALEPTLRAAFDVVLDLSEGHVDGGDVLVTPDKVFVGLSARTDEFGATALLKLLATLGRAGEIARTPDGTLHLKTASSLIDEETILATAQLAATGIFDGFRVLTVPEGEASGANVLRVNDVLLAGASYPHTRDILAAHGAKLVPLSVEEIGKVDAGLTCMSLRWWRV